LAWSHFVLLFFCCSQVKPSEVELWRTILEIRAAKDLGGCS
jgi:hypothetical protein